MSTSLKATAAVEATVTSKTELKPKVKAKLLGLFHLYEELALHIKDLQEQLGELKADIDAVREDEGAQSIEVDGYKVSQIMSTRATLNHKKLIAAGCAKAWIDDAMEYKPTKPYAKITLPTDKAEKED